MTNERASSRRETPTARSLISSERHRYVMVTDDEKYSPASSDQLDELKQMIQDVKGAIEKQMPRGETELLVPAWTQDQQKLELKFDRLANEWKAGTRFASTIWEMTMHRAYLQIIWMGPPVVPLILNRLADQPDHWFYALTAITGEDPVPENSRGNLEEMTKAWLKWGEEQGYDSVRVIPLKTREVKCL